MRTDRSVAYSTSGRAPECFDTVGRLFKTTSALRVGNTRNFISPLW